MSEDFPQRVHSLNDREIDPSISKEWREKHMIDSERQLNELKRDWYLLSQTIWDMIRDGDSEVTNYLQKLSSNPIGPLGLKTFLEGLQELQLTTSKNSRRRGISRITDRLIEYVSKNLILSIDGKLSEVEKELRPAVYFLSNASKDVLLMSLGANLLAGQAGGVDIQTFGEVPPELSVPANWDLRFNLKDRAWIALAGKKKFLLREQKSPQHFDHLFNRELGETVPLDEHSQPSLDEAKLANSFRKKLDTYTGIRIVAENPIAAVKFPENLAIDYQLGIYEFEEGMITDRSQMVEPLRALFESLPDVWQTYNEFKSKMSLLERSAIPTLSEYCSIRAEVLLSSIPYMLRKGFAEQGLHNSDADGFGLRVAPDGKLEVIVFDFERVQPLEIQDTFNQVIKNDDSYLDALKPLLSRYSLYNSPMDLMDVQSRFTPSIQNIQNADFGNISLLAGEIGGRFMELQMLSLFVQSGGMGNRRMAEKTKAKLVMILHSLQSLKIIPH